MYKRWAREIIGKLGAKGALELVRDLEKLLKK